MGLEFLDQICQTDDKLINNMLTFEFKQFDHIFNSPAVSRKQSNYWIIDDIKLAMSKVLQANKRWLSQ